MIRTRVTTSGFHLDPDKIIRKAMDGYERRAREKLATFRCPEHGEAPTIKSREGGFMISACCKEHAQRAAKRLKS